MFQIFKHSCTYLVGKWQHVAPCQGEAWCCHLPMKNVKEWPKEWVGCCTVYVLELWKGQKTHKSTIQNWHAYCREWWSLPFWLCTAAFWDLKTTFEIICILLLFSCFSAVSGYVILDWHSGWIDPANYLSFGKKTAVSKSHPFILVPPAFSHKALYIIPTSQPCPLFLSLLVARTWCLQQSSALKTSYWPRFAKICGMSSSEKAKEKHRCCINPCHSMETYSTCEPMHTLQYIYIVPKQALSGRYQYYGHLCAYLLQCTANIMALRWNRLI